MFQTIINNVFNFRTEGLQLKCNLVTIVKFKLSESVHTRGGLSIEWQMASVANQSFVCEMTVTVEIVFTENVLIVWPNSDERKRDQWNSDDSVGFDETFMSMLSNPIPSVMNRCAMCVER